MRKTSREIEFGNSHFFFFVKMAQCVVLQSTIALKKFREINSLVTSLVSTLIWRKKCWFSVFLTTFPHYCGNMYGNLLSRIFDKNFVKTTFLLKKLIKNWFHEKNFGERISCFSTLCWMRRVMLIVGWWMKISCKCLSSNFSTQWFHGKIANFFVTFTQHVRRIKDLVHLSLTYQSSCYCYAQFC